MTLTPADLAKILRNPDLREVNGHLCPAVAGQGSQPEALSALNVCLDASNQSRALHGVPTWRSEREFMAAVIAECDLRAIGQPEYGLVCHIPNENSHRNPGVRGGMPDLFWPNPRESRTGPYAGMFIELKVRGGKCSRAQLDMIHKLRLAGYHCVVVWDSVEAVMVEMERYLRGEV